MAFLPLISSESVGDPFYLLNCLWREAKVNLMLIVSNCNTVLTWREYPLAKHKSDTPHNSYIPCGINNDSVQLVQGARLPGARYGMCSSTYVRTVSLSPSRKRRSRCSSFGRLTKAGELTSSHSAMEVPVEKQTWDFEMR
jgi:hypothetical protein